MTLTNDARDIGRLLSYGLRPKVRPGAGGDYAALITRYRDDMTFRNAFDAVLDGLEVTVGHAGDLGLYLNPRRESVFAYKVSEESSSWTKDSARALRGLAHLGIAAYTYPHPDDLHDPSVRYVDVMQLVAFLRRAVDELRNRADAVEGSGDVVDDVIQLATTAGLDTAWSYWERMPDTDVGTTGRGSKRLSTKSTVYWVLRALRELVEFGLAKQVGKDSDGRFQLLERFRIQVGQYAMEEGYKALAALRRVDGGAADPRYPGEPHPLPGAVPAWAADSVDKESTVAASIPQVLPTEGEEYA